MHDWMETRAAEREFLRGLLNTAPRAALTATENWHRGQSYLDQVLILRSVRDPLRGAVGGKRQQNGPAVALRKQLTPAQAVTPIPGGTVQCLPLPHPCALHKSFPGVSPDPRATSYPASRSLFFEGSSRHVN